MAVFNVELRERVSGQFTDLIYVKSHWNILEGIPSTFTPVPHTHGTSDIPERNHHVGSWGINVAGQGYDFTFSPAPPEADTARILVYQNDLEGQIQIKVNGVIVVAAMNAPDAVTTWVYFDVPTTSFSKTGNNTLRIEHNGTGTADWGTIYEVVVVYGNSVDAHNHDDRYYTESESNNLFLGKTAKAADSDKLDGFDSKDFALALVNDGTTGLWHSTNANVTEYVDGLAVVLLVNGISGSGSGTKFEINNLGSYNIYYTDNSVLTTHYSPNTVVVLSWDADQSRWYCHDFYYSTEDYNMRWENSVRLGAATGGYQLLLECTDGKMYPITNGGDTPAQTALSTITNMTLKIGGKILYYNSGTNLAANAVTANIYEGEYSGEMEYWSNKAGAWATDYQPFYLVVQLQSDGSYKVKGANTQGTDYLTQTLPTTDDGYLYIQIGFMQDTWDAWRLQIDHPIYQFKDGKLRLYIPEHNHDASDINAGTLNVDRIPELPQSKVTNLETDLANKVIYNDAIMPRNSFGGKKLFISHLDNAFFLLNERYTVTAGYYNKSDDSYVGAASYATLFNSDYDGSVAIPLGQYLKINISFTGSGYQYNGVDCFPNYPYGYLYLSYYYTGWPNAAKFRVYCNYEPHGLGWSSYTNFTDFVSGGTSQKIQRAYQSKYAISEMEIIVEAPDSGDTTKLTQIDFGLDRPTFQEMPVVNKFNNQTFYKDVLFKAPIYLKDTKTKLEQADDNGQLKITTPTGWLEIGSANAGWTHFEAQSGRPFYFNQELRVAGNIGVYNKNTYLEYANGYIYELGQRLYSPNNKPTFAEIDSKPVFTINRLLLGAGNDTPTTIALGASGQVLKGTGGLPTWGTVAVSEVSGLGANDTLQIGHININDPGAGEGIAWLGGNLWKIYESDDALGNLAGNLQFVQNNTRRFVIQTDGVVKSLGTLYEGNNRVYSAANKPTKDDVGLGNVTNLDTSDPANITQSASYRFVTDTEKATWNAKQAALSVGDSASIIAGTDNTPKIWSAQNLKIGIESLSLNQTEGDARYVQEGGTSFSGEYPIVVRVGARNFYSDTDITFVGSTSTLKVSGAIEIGGIAVVKTNDARLSDARPASDVSSWAKAATKPTYDKTEVGLGNVDNTTDASKYVAGVKQTRDSANTLIWHGTQAQYDAIGTKSSNTLYFITA